MIGLVLILGLGAGAGGAILYSVLAGSGSVLGEWNVLGRGRPRHSPEAAGGMGTAAGSWKGPALRFGVPAACGALVGVVTGWFVAALIVFGGALAAPVLIRATRSDTAGGRVEEIAAWTEMLRDTLASSAGLAQAIVATSEIAPVGIRPMVQRLAIRIRSGVPMQEAVRRFGEELDDPSGDMVVAALLLASGARAQRLTDLLSELAVSMREEVAARLRIEASRASAKSGVRAIVVFSAAFFLGMILLARSYLGPYRTPTGQMVLAVVGACYALGVWLMLKMDRPPEPVRLLEPGTDSSNRGRAGPEGWGRDHVGARRS